MNSNYKTAFDREEDFENAVISLLKNCGWEKEIISYPDEATLLKNWADILYRNNREKDKLGDYPLTDSEMSQIIDQIVAARTPFALNTFINGGSVSIKRDNSADKLHFGKEISLFIFDRYAIAGGNTRYQIVKQPRFNTPSSIFPKRRGDIMLLINGMPLFHIELKKTGIPLSQACCQIAKYSRQGIFSGLFSLIQIFVAMTPDDAVYYTNPGIDGRFNQDFYFRWADFDNEPISNWHRFAQDLLSIPMAHRLIGFYTVADRKDGILKVLRSYQYYAVAAITSIVEQYKNKWNDRRQRGGYIWHTTGSGKTLTSFKVADLISKSQNADKVIFLVDRKELDEQSFTHYQNFADYEDEIQKTESTDILRSKLTSDSKMETLIVTSIQKMCRIKEDGTKRIQRDIEKINKKRIVFIVDECHRDTFGDMMNAVKETFSNALFFGFSGTPIQEENAKKGCTSADVFGNELHRYTIADGIRDGNVLAFDPHLVETFRSKELRQKVALEKAHAMTVDEALSDVRKRHTYFHYLKDVDMVEIENYIPLSQYRTDDHINAVVNDILTEYIDRSRGKKFHSIFATSSIPEAINYFRKFRVAEPELKITVLVDPSDNNSNTSYEKMVGLGEVIDYYNHQFNQSYRITTYREMKKDISLRLSHEEAYSGIDKTPEKQIDMLIVVNQMLTGFDSKWVNVLYLDKVMEKETIIQAFSRTNRVFGEDKPAGSIYYYRCPYTMNANIEKAVQIYAGDKAFTVFVDKLEKNLKRFNENYLEIKDLFMDEGINDLSHLPSNVAVRAKFASLFNNLNKLLEMIKVQGFSWGKVNSGLIETNITEELYYVLLQRYKELANPPLNSQLEDPPYDIKSYITEIEMEKIDTDYINSRFEKYLKLKNISGQSQASIDIALQEIYKSFALLSEEDQKYADIFIKDVQMGNVIPDKEKTLKDYIAEYIRRAKNDQIHRFACIFGIDENLLRESIELHLNEDNINEFGRLDKIKLSADYDLVKKYYSQTNEKLTIFKIRSKFDNLVRRFILIGGFDI